MAVHYRAKAIFLRKADLREADQLFTIYTEDFGKLKVLGRAIRKINSKLRAGAEPPCLSEIEFIQGKTRKTLTDAILIDKFPNLRKDLIKLRVAYKIADILDRFAVKEEKDEKVWQILNEVLGKMNDLRFMIYDVRLIYYYFFWNLVSLLGYQPKIENCSIQGKSVNCDIIKILKVILRRDWQILSRLKVEDRHLRLLKNISDWYKIEVYGPKK